MLRAAAEMFSRAAVLLRISLANIFSSALNLFVGAVLLFGAALLVIGGSIFTTLDDALSKSIVGSVSGHLQVYGARSKDALELYGRIDGSDSDLTPIDGYKALKEKLLAVPNVERVVPMGAATAMLTAGNLADVTLEKFRALMKQRDSLPPGEYEQRRAALEAHIRQMAAVLAQDVERAKQLTDDRDDEVATALALAQSADFWATFDEDPLGHLELLENKFAPVMVDGDLLFLRYLGTDLDAYQRTFDRMEIVEGTPVPQGHRGILMPRFFVEEYLKLKNARRLDKMRDARAAGRTLADTEDKELQRWAKENVLQTREIVLQLDALGTAEAVAKLQAHLSSKETELAKLLAEFFTVTDGNFEQRYEWFYANLAPMLSLYKVKAGDTMALKSVGKAGSIQTAMVKMYGVFEFRGLEKSPLAGVNALVDLVTFRELYGFLTEETKAELDALKAETGAREVNRESAEADLFGGDSEVVEVATATEFSDDLPGARGEKKARALSDTFALTELDDGVVMNAAVWLKDGSEAAQLAAQHTIEKALGAEAPPVNAASLDAARALLAKKSLPFALSMTLEELVSLEEARAKGEFKPTVAAMLAVKEALKADKARLEDADILTIQSVITGATPKTLVVSWNTAAGFLGNFITFFRALLVAIVAAFAFFALIVVTIGMTIATLQRTSTIGTMRAIGAQRGFVVAMVTAETVVLALVFGALGAAVGAVVVQYLHATGIPAFRDELYFFFSGPVLRPELTVAGVVSSIAVTLVVGVVAVIFPLYLATRVSPIVAMQSQES